MITTNGHTLTSTSELARLLGTTNQKVRQKADKMKTQIDGFNCEGYQLTKDETKAMLSVYLEQGRVDSTLITKVANELGVELLPVNQPQPNTELRPQPNPKQPNQEPVAKSQPSPVKAKDSRFIEWLKFTLSVLPLPTLGLAASYGVYHFSSNFVPNWVAVVEACGFESVYIGLAVSKNMPDNLRKRIQSVSWGAVAVSVIYNSLSAALTLNPKLLTEMHPVFFWLISVTQGAPLAVLAFFVADLVLHRKK
jgi:hypothetical protein